MDFTLKTEQKQTLSYKMIQASTILQMTSVQLEQYLNEQSLENPVLELTPAKTHDADSKTSGTYDWISSHDEQNRYLYQHLESEENEFPEWNMEHALPETLAEHLWSQLLTRTWPKEQEEALQFLLNVLDERGYFTDSLEIFAEHFGLSMEQANVLLSLIQSLEPAGVGARTLEECLCLQLDRRGQLTEEFRSFLHENLPLIAKNQLAAIARNTKLSMDTIKAYCEQIRKLEPKPAAPYAFSGHSSYVLPDVIMSLDKYHTDICLNDSIYPDITLNTGYLQLYEECPDKEVHTYLQQKIKQVEWLKQCMIQRRTTLLSVVKAIQNMQQEFFLLGPNHLKPLKQADIADYLGIHVSTVSRACNQKYLQCSWGTFPLSIFFVKAAALQTVTPATPVTPATTLDVRKALAALIESENKEKPYSDRILAELLTEQGFSVSRRTVAKYRDELSIPGTSGRKKY
ncbi:MAG: RNA polymerase factor sigma-54 [Lachnospiraceae bacterium]|nr:RNA polymerase factor sigma-54 [Lachnospiraceae bacterium]